MRFPATIRHRSSTAKIYARTKDFPFYRVAYTVAGKRRMQTFKVYSDANAAAERIVRETASGSQAAALSASQSRDALAALQSLESFRQSTGRAVSLLAAVREFVEASGKLHGRSLDEAVTGYLRTVVSVKRKDIAEAVAEFLLADAPRTKAAEGQRAQSPNAGPPNPCKASFRRSKSRRKSARRRFAKALSVVLRERRNCLPCHFTWT